MNCNLCGHNVWREYSKRLVQCQICQLVVAKEKYFKFDIQKVYSKKYFKGGEYLDYEEEKTDLLSNFKKRLSEIVEYKKSGRLLDVGASYGYFCEVAEKYFDVFGIDVSKDAVAEARNAGLKVVCGEYLEKKYPSKFDVITLWDTVEHLTDPNRYFEKINKDLNKNGVMVITTGDIGTILPRFQKDNWRLIHPPTHLYYFTKKTMHAMLEKNGFEVVKFNYPIVWRSLGQILYLSFVKKYDSNGKWVNLFSKLKINVPLNTFDIMFVVARKK